METIFVGNLCASCCATTKVVSFLFVTGLVKAVVDDMSFGLTSAPFTFDAENEGFSDLEWHCCIVFCGGWEIGS